MEELVSRRNAIGRICRAACVTGTSAVFGARPAAAQSATAEAAFEALARRHGFVADGPGVAAYVGRPGGREATFAFGKASLGGDGGLGNGVPMRPGTLCELASVSKIITSTAALMLCERKEMSLGDDVRKFIPELPAYDEKRPVRIEDLLRHTSGLPDYMGLGEVAAKNRDYAVNDDYVAELGKRKDSAPLAFPTGRKHVYNNTNYMLLATVIGRVAKKPYSAFLREAMFEPAGMTDTFVYDSPADVPEGAARSAAIGYVKEGDAWTASWGLPPGRRERLLTVGDGGIWSNVRDMAAWSAALHAGKFVSAESAKLALAPTKTPDGETHGYGMGWGLYYRDGGVMYGYGHNGGWGGFVTCFCHEPEPNLTTVVLSNRGDFNVDAFWYDLRETLDRKRPGGDGRPQGRRRRG